MTHSISLLRCLSSLPMCPSTLPFSEKSLQWRETKAERERQIKMCSRFYLYTWEVGQKNSWHNFFVIYSFNMLFMFDLWHSQGGIAEGSRGWVLWGKRDRCGQMSYGASQAQWSIVGERQHPWSVLVCSCVFFGRYNQMTYFWQRGFQHVW